MSTHALSFQPRKSDICSQPWEIASKQMAVTIPYKHSNTIQLATLCLSKPPSALNPITQTAVSQ